MNNEIGKKEKLARTFFDQAYHLQMSGYLDRAIHFYKRSIQYSPTAKAHTFLGWTYSLKGLYERAIEECLHATELDPNFGNSYNDIGAYLIQLKKYDEAIPWLKKALEAPDYGNYCYPNLNLGYIYEFKGQWDLALEYYKTAIEENENYQPVLTAYEKLLGKYN
jgi:Tfp pilus assembly protein PilF